MTIWWISIYTTYNTTYLMQNSILYDINTIKGQHNVKNVNMPNAFHHTHASDQLRHSNAHCQMKSPPKTVPTVDWIWIWLSPFLLLVHSLQNCLGDNGCSKAIMTLCDRGPCWTSEEPKTAPATSVGRKKHVPIGNKKAVSSTHTAWSSTKPCPLFSRKKFRPLSPSVSPGSQSPLTLAVK